MLLLKDGAVGNDWTREQTQKQDLHRNLKGTPAIISLSDILNQFWLHDIRKREENYSNVFLFIYYENAEDEKTESHYNTKEMKTLTSFFCCC